MNHRARARALLRRVFRQGKVSGVVWVILENQIMDALRQAEYDGRRTGLNDAAIALFKRAKAVPAVDGQQLQRDALNAAATAVAEMR